MAADYELRTEERGSFGRWTQWQSHARSTDVGAVVVDDEPPTLFEVGKVLVGRDDRELIEECIALGGEVMPDSPLPPPPPELRGTRRVNEEPLLAPVRIRFAGAPTRERPSETLPEIVRTNVGRLENQRERTGRLLASSEPAAALASFVARHTADGRDISLNLLGTPDALPLRSPFEHADAAPEGGDPTTWAGFGTKTRIVEAWHLVESARTVRSIEPVVWVAIFDCGYWLDAAGIPKIAVPQTASDLGPAVAQFNHWGSSAIGSPNPVRDSTGGLSPWHGNRVASVATAAVGNLIGAAGTGGTVARPFLFKIDYSWCHTIDCLRRCVAWGLDIVNMSYSANVGSFLGINDVPSGYGPIFEQARQLGVIIVAAAGNQSSRLPDLDIRPATRTPGVITVGALNGDAVAPRSNYGPSVDVWAPGVNIPVMPDGSMSPFLFSGTSAAAPFVAGVIAMMRAVNPDLHTDLVGEILQRTGWDGTGNVTKGVDAYAAVLDALGGKLPPDPWEPNNSAATARQLLPAGPGSVLEVRAMKSASDVDCWRFELTDLSNVKLDVEWYERLGSMAVSVEPDDPDATGADEMHTAGGPPKSGLRSVKGVLSPGGYVVSLRGTGSYAYELRVRSSPFDVDPDMFEPNDSFDQAACLVFVPPDPFVVAFNEPTWGPGTFHATLHRRFGRMNADFFKLIVPPVDDEVVPAVFITRTDRLIDITLFDETRQPIGEWSQVRSRTIVPPADSTCFLRVSGENVTRYDIGVQLFVDPRILPGEVEEAEVLPPWWRDPFDFDIVDEPIHFVVDLPDAEHRDPRIAFTGPASSIQLELLDLSGALVRAGDDVDAATSVETGGLEAGRYLLRITRAATLAESAPTRVSVAAPQMW